MGAGPRSGEERVRDSLAWLQRQGSDVWVATASTDGAAYLVPLSLAWDGQRVILATDRSTLTARNIEASRAARLALGESRDVVMADAELDGVVPVTEAPSGLADRYAAQTGWDPRHAGDGQVLLMLRPVRIQAWREVDEIFGRTIMRGGCWLFSPAETLPPS